MHIAIIGGVAGGASAATRARRLDEHADITIYEKGPYVSYANCGLPYYAGGLIANADDLLLETPVSLWDRFRIRVLTNTWVTQVEPDAGRLRYENLSGSGEAGFDRLILAPGSVPVVPNIPGIDRADVFRLRTVAEAIRLRDYLEGRPIHHAAVIGAGFIGLEVAEVLNQRGIEVTMVDRGDHVLPPIDVDIARFLEARISDLGVHLALSNTVTGIRGVLHRPVVDLSSGMTLSADLVVVGLGVRPSVALAQQMGLALGRTGAIQVDRQMRTSHANVWAAGDAVEKYDLVTEKQQWWPLAGAANKEGRVAGTNAAGGHATLAGTLGTAIVRFSPYVAGVTGLTEQAARREDIPYRVLHTIRGHHAGYYPGASDILIKLLYDPNTGRILGAQAVGQHGVDKRIDVIATAIHGRMTVNDLADLDLAYSPPLGSAKDPVIITGMSASNHHGELVRSISAPELAEWLGRPGAPLVLDVRERMEMEETGVIPGAQHIPLNDLRGRVGEMPKDRSVVTYCRSGHRSYVAARILSQNGLASTYNLSGGMTIWKLTQATETPVPLG